MLELDINGLLLLFVFERDVVDKSDADDDMTCSACVLLYCGGDG